VTQPNRAAGRFAGTRGRPGSPRGADLRVVVVTNLYPSDRRPGWGTYVAARVAELRAAGVAVELLKVPDVPSAAGRYGSLVSQTAGGVLEGLRARVPAGAPGPAEHATDGKHRRPHRLRKLPGRGALADRHLPKLPQLPVFAGLPKLPGLPNLSVPPAYPGRTVVEAHIAYPTGLFAWPLARSLAAPLVLYAHGSDVLAAPHRSRADALLAPRLLGAADLVVANSAYLAGEVERLGVAPERVEVISPGIDYRAFSGARDRAGADGVLRHDVAYVGHLIERKGPDLVLAGVAGMSADSRPRIQVIGAGPMEAALRAQAARDRLDVVFVGSLPPAEVAARMARAAVVAVPSRQEALGLAALEAMAAGAVTVVTRVGGLGELIEDGRTGFVADLPEPASVTMALTSALAAADDPERAGPLRMRADRVAAAHAAPAAVARSLDRYEALLAARAGRRELTRHARSVTRR